MSSVHHMLPLFERCPYAALALTCLPYAGLHRCTQTRPLLYPHASLWMDTPVQVFPIAALNSLMECPHLMELLMGGVPRRRGGDGDATDSDEEDEEGDGPANARCRVH